MATKYIITQAWSIRHIVTRGFGPFVDTNFGQGEIIELGIARVSRTPEMQAGSSKQIDLVAYVLVQPEVAVER